MIPSLLGVFTFEVGEEIDPAVMILAIAAAGAVALGLALAAGAGFRIGKKAYSWVMGKM